MASARPHVLKAAHVFSGSDPAFAPIKGYHGYTLPGKLQADLGSYWQEHRAEWGDDAVAVLFDWLGAHVVAAAGRADGDDHLLEAALRPSVQYAVRVLLGVEERRAPPT